MRYDGLIGVEQLAGVIDSPDCVVVDCRFDLADAQAGRRAYNQSHLPDARYAHLDEQLSGPVTATSGRHPLPDAGKFCDQLGQWGVSSNSQVVAYDDSGGPFAARLWWLLKWLGHSAAAVLDGGYTAWESAGQPVTAVLPQVEPTAYTAAPNTALWVTSACLEQDLRDQRVTLIDARAPDRFRGDTEPIDTVAGHIPGAINLPWKENLNQDARFLPPEQLAARFRPALGRDPQLAVHTCGSGVTACHNLLAMHAAGLPSGRLYAGSWSEWIRDPTRPVAQG